MTEISQVDIGNTVFVDVTTGQQYPISDEFSDLLQSSTVVKDETQIVNVSDADDEPNKSTDNSKTATDTNTCIDIQKRRIRCPECQRYTAETEEKMLRHIRKVHRGENPFQCYMCDYSTYNKSLFEEHVRIHQGIKPYKCSHCPYRSVSKKNTKKHELIHRPDNPLKCPDCNFIARHAKSLQCHQTKKHFIDKIKELDVEWQKCPRCPFKYKLPIQFRNHKKSRKRCEHCLFSACTKRILIEHVVKEHKMEIKVSNLFNCTLCKWGSNSKPRILLHLIHHPNQTVDENLIDVSVLRLLGIME